MLYMAAHKNPAHGFIVHVEFPYTHYAKGKEQIFPDFQLVATVDHEYTFYDVVIEIRSNATPFLQQHMRAHVSIAVQEALALRTTPTELVVWFQQEIIAWLLSGHLYFDKVLQRWNWELNPLAALD